MIEDKGGNEGSMPGITGYRVRRGPSSARLSEVRRVTSTTWADYPQDLSGTLLYYEVTARIGSNLGTATEPLGMVTQVDELVGEVLYALVRSEADGYLQFNPGGQQPGSSSPLSTDPAADRPAGCRAMRWNCGVRIRSGNWQPWPARSTCGCPRT